MKGLHLNDCGRQIAFLPLRSYGVYYNRWFRVS